MNANDPSLDETFDPDELDQAVNDRAPGISSPELDERTEFVTTWDEPPASHGSQAPRNRLDDEQDVGGQLVDEGLDTADTEQRVAAADRDGE